MSKITKRKKEGWIAGVCAGIAHKSDIHVGIIRVIFFCGGAAMFWIYIAAAIFLEEE